MDLWLNERKKKHVRWGMLNLFLFRFNICRWSRDKEWETHSQNIDFGWMQIAEPVMKLYTESTDGSSVETKESALVWHHQDADPGFGSAQAKELLDHLESVLANEPVSVKSGQFIIEVKPQVCISMLYCLLRHHQSQMYHALCHTILDEQFAPK